MSYSFRVLFAAIYFLQTLFTLSLSLVMLSLKRLFSKSSHFPTALRSSVHSSGYSTASSMKTANNCSEILSYMGGLESDQKQLIKKLVNFRMKAGKRNRTRAILYQTIHRLAKTEQDGMKLMSEALQNIEPVCEVKKVARAGTAYDVPRIVGRDRQQTLAVRWILDAATKKHTTSKISLEKCLFSEILDAYRKRGVARKKRESLHSLSSTNRSYASFRWW